MNLEVTGKRALITGSTAGIGYAIAERLAEEGARVIVNGRTEQRVEQALKKLKRPAEGLAADLGTAEGAKEAIRAFPEVEILVNNVGIYRAQRFEDIGDEDWYRLFDVNVMSGVRLSRHYLPKMLERNWGRIVFISSESALQIPAEMIHYGMTKTAQLAISRGMAETTAGTGVTVNAVLPGPTASEALGGFVAGVAKQRGVTADQIEREFFEKTRPTSLIKRFATPEEVAAMVAYVCSGLASATNGAALRVDGGVVRAIA